MCDDKLFRVECNLMPCTSVIKTFLDTHMLRASIVQSDLVALAPELIAWLYHRYYTLRSVRYNIYGYTEESCLSEYAVVINIA